MFTRRGKTLLIWTVFAVGSVATDFYQGTCYTDEHKVSCEARCDELVAGLREPIEAPPSTTGICLELSSGDVGCGCFVVDEQDDEGPTALTVADLGDDAYEVFIGAEVCQVFGRLGDCLFPPETFEGCLSGEVSTCLDICGAVDQARIRDAVAIDDASLVENECRFDCRCAVEAGGACVRFNVRDVNSEDVIVNGTNAGNVYLSARLDSCDDL